MGGKAIFSTTASIEPKSKLITDIKEDFLAMIAKLKDLFKQTLIRSGKQVKILLVFTIPEMTEPIIHRSTMNRLQAANLWLDSELISASRRVTIGWLEYGNPDYT